MKPGPHCAEEIPAPDTRSKPCAELLPPPVPNPAGPWYFRTSSLVIALCNLPPLALPMVWWRPNKSIPWKIGMTFVILFATVALCWLLVVTVLVLSHVSRQIIGLMNSF